MFDGRISVIDDDSTNFSVHLEETFSSTLLYIEGSDSQQLDDQHLALFDFNAHFLVDLGLSKEESSGKDAFHACLVRNRQIWEGTERNNSPQITEFIGESSKLFEHLGVHVVRRNIAIGNVLAKLFSQFSLDFLELQWLHCQTRSSSDPLSVSDNLGSKWLREPTIRFTEVSLEELDNTLGEVQAVGLFENLVLCEIVGHHELGKVTYYLTVNQERQLRLAYR
jgi:hypothetical protein